MNDKERFYRVTHFMDADRAPNTEIGFASLAVDRWHNEGLSRDILPSLEDSGVPKTQRPVELDLLRPEKFGLNDYFGFDRYMRYRIPVNAGAPVPSFHKILEDDGKWQLFIDEWGIRRRALKNSYSMDEYLEHPVKTRKDWEEYKKRLNPDSPERFPALWREFVVDYKNRDYPLSVFRIVGFLHFPRYLMGFENLMMAYYDQPDLIMDMLDYWCEFNISLAKKVFKDVKADWVTIGEDMAYKGRSMISPEMFRKFMLPFYRRLTGFLRDNGVDVIFVDSDGYVHELIPLWIEGGVNGTWPLEIAAGNDLIKLRREYPDFILSGGIDKMAVARGKEAIDKELYGKLPALLPLGGFIPSIDHVPPEDVSLENWTYYSQLKKKLLGQYPPRPGKKYA
jgi:uroporphyrinogen decarboxylase